MVDWTNTTNLPLNNFIVGKWNNSSDVASPLQAALNMPSPSTLNFNWQHYSFLLTTLLHSV
jgi:hypothetical protein